MTQMTRGKSRFQELDQRVRQLLRAERTTNYEVGDLLAHIRDEGAWQEAGFASFNAYLRSFGGRHTTLRARLALADAVPKEIALAYDPEWLGLALELLPPDANGNVVISPQTLRRETLKVKRGGHSVEVPFAGATYEELETAWLHRNRLMSAPDALVQQCEKAVQTVGDGEIEFAPRRRRKQVGLGVFVPEHRVAEFLSWLAAAKRPASGGASRTKALPASASTTKGKRRNAKKQAKS